jgi:hypothetical protein
VVRRPKNPLGEREISYSAEKFAGTELDAGTVCLELCKVVPGREAGAHGVHAVHEHVVNVSGSTCLKEREEIEIIRVCCDNIMWK